MKTTIYVLICVLLFTFLVPVSAYTADPTGSIRWVDDGKNTITSQYLGRNLTLTFDTLNDGQTPGAEIVDKYAVVIHAKDLQTNTFMYLDTSPLYLIANSSTTYTYNTSTNWKQFSGERWRGYSTYLPTNALYPAIPTVWRAKLVFYNSTSHNQYVDDVYADLPITDNPYQLTNISAWLEDIGGVGLRYLVAVLIIILLASVPFLLLRRMVVILEIMMIALGLGATYMMGLIDLWVPFGIGLALIAIFFLMRGQNPPRATEV